MDLFLSTFESKIDKKGRASIPARYRSLLERNNEELILFTTPETQYIQGCGNNYINRLSNWQTAAEILGGLPYNFNVISVIIPNVPSDPTKILVRSYPAELFLALPPF